MEIKEITVQELKNKMDNNDDFQLIDVRENHEYKHVNIGGTLIPLSELEGNSNQISSEKPVIVMCRSGVRSANAIRFLQSNFGYNNLYNLKGGILEWADKIDPDKPKY